AMTLTVQKYYRITGASTQYQGVVPDVVLPDAYAYLDLGEKSQPHSLPWDTIPPLTFSLWKNSCRDLDEIKVRSRQRLEQSARFGLITANISRLRKQREKTMVTLHLEKFRAEQDMLFQEVEKYNRAQVDFAHLQVRPLEAVTDDRDVKRKEWLTDLRRDPVIEEATRVLYDWVALAAAR
ncbi:MAG TPA: carboxy terminal-processing peptidase, partial [Candidatus Binatia bacterium]|nr:carboxy terminal-processing peptidase [Candidatus Binatia bacterium]